MNYYKIKSGDTVIDVNCVFLKWQEKHRVLVDCPAEEAQFIITSDQLHVYHVPWLHKVPAGYGEYESIDAVPIEKEEYTALKATLETGESVEEPDEEYTGDDEGGGGATEQEEEQPEAVLTLPEMRRQIIALQAANEELAARNEMLEECILEMSEIIYQ